MPSRRFLPPIALTILLALVPLAPLPSLDTTSLATDWHWIREAPEEWQLNPDGQLQLRTQPGQIWAGKDDAKNILAHKTPLDTKAPATLEATVTLDDPVRKWEQAGLLVYIDDTSFIKFVVEFIDDDLFVVLAREHKGKRQVLAKTQIPKATARLRLEVTGDQILGTYRTDPKAIDWTEAAQSELPADLKRHFALFTQNGPAESFRTATFTDLELAPSE
ncbi:MAG: DUF1349 domain-containing protein [Verrucomicrobiota bacterium]